MTATQRHGGLGLGMAITRHLVEQHGGTIHAVSAGVGSGTTIVTTLPVSGQTALSRFNG
ncbi:MAG: ATP-binding protein [Acidobacteriota bacterium]|nr:ATP-binding protein [Acidobacteriota bacterium]